MQSTRSLISASIVALLVSIGPSANAASAPADAGDERSPVAAPDADRAAGLVLDHVMLDEANPGFIVPCVRVLRKFVNKARNDSSLTVRIELTYQSRGVQVARTFFVPLASMEVTEHHEQPSNRSWLLVDAVIDIADQPVDAGSTVTGTAELVERGSTTDTPTAAGSRPAP